MVQLIFPYCDSLASDEIWCDDLPLKVQHLQFPKDLGHYILRSALRPNTQVPLRSLHGSVLTSERARVRGRRLWGERVEEREREEVRRGEKRGGDERLLRQQITLLTLLYKFV